MGCVLHLDRFLFQPIWNQMYNCQFVWPFCLEYQNITCMDRSLSRCASGDFYLERESLALSGFRKRPKLCGTFAKVSTKLSHATSYRHLNLLTKFQKVFYWQKFVIDKDKDKDQDKDTVCWQSFIDKDKDKDKVFYWQSFRKF